ncbi:peptidoglycan recognition family protein [Paludisphaera sp.]|uniref:peptidoglycan recognition protein family protein n=1 Tax=Paludisphaera sp. TaxID=2017432 RepID=UPI00301D69D7
MADKISAPFAVRAHRACLVMTAVGALLTAGCHRKRTVLRPVMPGARAVAAPGCSDCGGDGGAAVIQSPGATIRSGGSFEPADEPVINGSSIGSIPSEVELSPPAAPTSSRRTPSSERIPTAAPDNDLDLAPAASTTRSRSLRPPVESKPKAKADAAGDALELSSPTSMTPGGPGSLKSTSASGVVRRASAQGALEGFFAGDGADDLFFPDKADRPWKYVVVHHSATESGSYSEIDAEHRQILGSADGCGYHFVIGNGTGSGDGQIEVSQRWVRQKHGVHCRNARRADIDEYGIGVCLIGDFEKAPPTPKQQAALKALLAYLGEKYQIDQSRLETHKHVAATPTVCPGRHFPEAALDPPSFRGEAQADARPVRREIERRAVPTAWRTQEGDLEVPVLSGPAR